MTGANYANDPKLKSDEVRVDLHHGVVTVYKPPHMTIYLAMKKARMTKAAWDNPTVLRKLEQDRLWLL